MASVEVGVAAGTGLRGGLRWPRWSRFALPRSGVARRVLMIVLIGLLPLALLSFGTLFRYAQIQREQLLSSAIDRMRAVAVALDTELALSIASLDALAASPRLAAGELEGFRAEAQQLLARRSHWANIVLSDARARQILNTHVPPGAPLPEALDPESVRRVAQGERNVVGDLVDSAALGGPAFAVHVPVWQRGELAYVLSAVVRPESLIDVLARQNMPQGGVVGVYDRRHHAVARTLQHEQALGKPSPTALDALLRSDARRGAKRMTTREGLDTYTAFHRAPESGWAVVAGLPAEDLEGPIRQSYAVLGGSIVVSLLLGVGAALLVGLSITRPMRELERSAKALSGSSPPPLPRTALPEVRQIAQAMAEAHAAREQHLLSEREAHRREQEARIDAERANRSKDEFLAMLGHELRNPLSAIGTAVALLERSGDGSSRAAHNARDIIQRQVRHLARMTDDLLDAGRLVSGKVQLQRAPLELSALVQRGVEAQRQTPRAAGHEIGVSLQPVWVQADATRLEQVLANLLTNALKYTPVPGRIEVSLAQEGAQAVLRVRDDGVGLDPELQPRVFDLFVQGGRSLDRSQGGMGIGLTLVRQLVELHGGRVAAQSEGPGRGAEFEVRLPAIDPPVPPHALPAAAAPAQRRRRVLIVEDNADIRAALRHLVSMDGHEVTEAADGPGGLAALLAQRPDVALVDIGLPGMDGYALARAVRASHAADTRLIALTGYGQPEDMARGRRAGFDEFMVKPADPDRLRRAIAGPEAD